VDLSREAVTRLEYGNLATRVCLSRQAPSREHPTCVVRDDRNLERLALNAINNAAFNDTALRTNSVVHCPLPLKAVLPQFAPLKKEYNLILLVILPVNRSGRRAGEPTAKSPALALGLLAPILMVHFEA
jgi:hypothetical protein